MGKTRPLQAPSPGMQAMGSHPAGRPLQCHYPWDAPACPCPWAGVSSGLKKGVASCRMRGQGVCKHVNRKQLRGSRDRLQMETASTYADRRTGQVGWHALAVFRSAVSGRDGRGRERDVGREARLGRVEPRGGVAGTGPFVTTAVAGVSLEILGAHPSDPGCVFCTKPLEVLRC